MNAVQSRRLLLAGSLALFLAGGCSDDTANPGPDLIGPGTEIPNDPGEPGDPGDPIDPFPEDPEPKWPDQLLESSELTHGLFGWPETNFGRGNSATIQMNLRRGDAATDFTLRDRQGEPHALSDLLIERPVLLVLGSFT